LNHPAGANVQHVRRYLGSIDTDARKTVLGRKIFRTSKQDYRG
jgi:hypothetical protein